MPFQPKTQVQRPFPPINPTKNAMRSIAAAIIAQAVDDWIFIIRHGLYTSKSGPISFTEIREFLSEEGFGDDLCDFLSLDATRILNELERHRHNFECYGVLPPVIIRRNEPAKYE